MTGRMTAADTVCCTSNEEFGGRILKHPFLHFSHSLSESISHASFRCSSRREEPSDMTLNVDFTPCHSCKLINLDLTSGFHQPLWRRSRGAPLAAARRRDRERSSTHCWRAAWHWAPAATLLPHTSHGMPAAWQRASGGDKRTCCRCAG